MTDIRDRNDQPPAIAVRFTVDRVVEVLRVRTVYGYQRQFAQVLAPALRVGRDTGGHLRRLRLDPGRKFVRDAVRQDGRQGLRSRIVEMTQHADDLPDGMGPPGGMCGDLDTHQVICSGALALPFRDEHPDPLTPFHFHPVDSAITHQTPGDFLDSPLQNLDHAAFGTAISDADARCHAISIPKAAHFPGREVDVLVAAVRRQKAVTVLARAHPANDKIQVVSQAVLACAIANELPVPNHGLEPAPECALIPGALEPQMSREGYERKWAPRSLHRLDNFGARRDGMSIPTAIHN